MIELESHVKDFMQDLTTTKIQNWGSLESLLQKRSIKKGEHFFQHFDKCNEVAIVSRGLFRIYLIDQEGEERTYSFIPENPLF